VPPIVEELLMRRVSIVLVAAMFAAAGCAAEPELEVSKAQVQQTVESLNDYWSSESPTLGFEYRDVPLNRVVSMGSAARCDGQRISKSDVEDNAYVDGECTEGIMLAYDPNYLQTSMARAEGTLSHEWGHIIQAEDPSIDLSQRDGGLPIDAELQADCFSGAWTGTDATANVAAIRSDVRDAGDVDPVPVDDPDAHGTPEERVSAFNLGLEYGADACVNELAEQLPGR
jgi:predicted metalloprotease